jgi:hypothetical protein
MSDFELDTIITLANSQVTISCRLGLWSVTAPSYDIARGEAEHYHRQYHDEYQEDDDG